MTTSFTLHTPSSAPDGAGEPLRDLERRIGFIPNLAATIGGSATAIAGFGALQGMLRSSKLTALEREVVGLTVSFENASEYSMAAHTVFALGASGSEEVVTALRSGAPVPDARLRALQELTQALVRERGHIETDLSAEDVLEVITQIAYTTFANLAANVARTPVDEAFAAHAWSAAVGV